MNAAEITLWGFVAMAVVSLVGGWLLHRYLEKDPTDAQSGPTSASPHQPR